jgi:hypothetical protein
MGNELELKEEKVESGRDKYLKAVVLDPKKMQGVWELKIELSNSQGTKAFGGRRLTTYIHPWTGTRVPLIDLDNQETLGYMIDKPTMRLQPDSNPMDRRIVDWLIAHPEVGVQGIELTDLVKIKKMSNPTITLKNVDRQELSEIDNQDTIDVIIGKLSDDNPKTGVSLERLRYLLAHFNLPYFDIRWIKNKTTEKKLLRQKIKNFARGTSAGGELNASLIGKVFDDIDNLKYSYEFKEMLRYDIIREANGIYKFNNVPIGSNEDSVINWLKTNLEIYTEMVGELYPRLKADGFTFK